MSRVSGGWPWAITAAGLGVVVCLVVWPGLVGFAAAALAGTGAAALLLGVRGLIRGPKTITAPAERQVTAQTDPAADPADEGELTAEEARGLADDLGRELYRAEDALAFVAECCDIADREARPVTTARVREWLKGAQCARQAGLVLDPDASGAGPETARTNPDGPEAQPVDQPGDDPDDLRTRLAAAIRDAARNCDSKCGLTEAQCAAAHPIQIEYWTDDVVSGVAGPIDALADVAEATGAFAEHDAHLEDDDGLTDSDSDVLALISEIASRLTDATDEGEYQAAGLIGDLANGRLSVAEAREQLADITFRHV